MSFIAHHPENLHIGKRYRFAIDCGDVITYEEGELRKIEYDVEIMLRVRIERGVTSEFFWSTVLAVESMEVVG